MKDISTLLIKILLNNVILFNLHLLLVWFVLFDSHPYFTSSPESFAVIIVIFSVGTFLRILKKTVKIYNTALRA